MSTITLPNIRQASAVTLNLKLKDNGVYVDWSGLSDISAVMFSDEQQVQSGDFDLTVSSEDGTVLICEYPGDRYEHLGVNRIIVVANYHDRQKAFDKAFGNFVGSTDEVAGDQVVIDDPVLDVEIDVADVSTSLLDAAIADAFSAAQMARALAGKTPILGDDGNWYVYDYDLDQYVDSGQAAQGASIYELAVKHGYTGTEEEYLALYTSAVEAANAAANAATDSGANAQSAAESAWTAQEEAQSAALEASNAADDASMAAEAANEAAQDANMAASSAGTSAAAANEAADMAETAAESANAAADAALDAAAAVDGAAENADEKAALAAEAAAGASSAAEAANDAADDAALQAAYAKDMGDYAKGEIDGAKGEFESLDDRFNATEEAAIEVDETTDPDSPEYQDEYQRVLRVLYQAITDARYAIGAAKDATAAVSQAAGEAGNAAAAATAAAAVALENATLAMNAAAEAAHALDSAKGGYGSLDDRIHAIETGKQDAIADLDTIRSNAETGAAAYQKPAGGIPKGDLATAVQETLDDVDLVFEPSDNPSDLA